MPSTGTLETEPREPSAFSDSSLARVLLFGFWQISHLLFSLVRFRFDEVVCDEAVCVMQLLQEKPTGWVKRK